MKDPLLAGKIISAVAGAIHKPVTVKIRKALTTAASMRWKSPVLPRKAALPL